MNEIDEMDMLGFLRVRVWKARQEDEKNSPKQVYIDDVWSVI